MSRDLTTDVENATLAANVPLVVFARLDITGATLRVCNASYDMAWDGYTWLGAGRAGAIDVIEEGGAIESRRFILSLSGIPAGMLATALGTNYQGRDARIWFAPLDANYRVIADPVGPFRGRMDIMPFSLGETATIKLHVVDRLADMFRQRVLRYNDATQQKLYAGDRFCEQAEAMVEKTLVW